MDLNASTSCRASSMEPLKPNLCVPPLAMTVMVTMTGTVARG